MGTGWLTGWLVGWLAGCLAGCLSQLQACIPVMSQCWYRPYAQLQQHRPAPPSVLPAWQGVSCAVTVRVSNALGAALPRAARRGAYTAAALTVLTQACLAAAIVLGRNHWAAAFTNLEEVGGLLAVVCDSAAAGAGATHAAC